MASSPGGGNLSYSVSWGDEVYAQNQSAMTIAPLPQQSATFTHSYSRAGTYTPVFTVSNSGGSTQTSLSVNVKAVACTSSGYDSTTGFRCGCSSTSGWSSTTGESCGTTEQIEVLITSFTSALGGTNGPVMVGHIVDIFGANFNSKAQVLINHIGEGYYGLLNYISPSHVNFVVPASLSTSYHTIEIAVPRSDGRGSTVSNAVNLRIVANYYPGCQAYSGYSSIDGNSCRQ